MDRLPIRRALLSVTHKDGLAEFARFLHDRGWNWYLPAEP